MMCQDCNIQLEQVCKFLGQVKNSDDYLKTLLLADQNFNRINGRLKLKKIKSKRKGRKEYIRKSIKYKLTAGNHFTDLKENPKNDKLYLIVVGKANDNSLSQSEICIKDLDLEGSELTDFCRSVLTDKLYDHTYSCEKSNLFTDKIMNPSVTGNNELVSEKNSCYVGGETDKTYNVNVSIYQCNECEESFEYKEHLAEHSQLCHRVEASNSEFEFICPVCFVSENEKNVFMDHLREHAKDGFSFLKVNRMGEHVPLPQKEFEEISDVAKLTGCSKIKFRVFKITMDCFKCLLCGKLIESIKCFNDHFKECSQDCVDKCFTPHIKYTCPACLDTWIDDVENFNIHLLAHKGDNVFFVKVNNSGESVNLGVNDFMFTPFEKIVEMLTFEPEYKKNSNNLDKKRTKIIKIQDICRCNICNYDANSFNLLIKHYTEIHQVVRTSHELYCPVCFEQFSITNVDNSLIFCNHLRNHMKEGILFVKVKKSDGSISGCSDNFELFTGIDEFFAGKLHRPELEYFSDVSVPQLFMEKVSNSDKRFYCDFCSANFGRKRDIIDHLKLHAKDTSRASREYICEKCGRRCCGKGNYNRHFVTHLQKSRVRMGIQKRPKCSVCNKTFSNAGTLNEHKQHHLNEGVEAEDTSAESSAKICEVCGRKFASNSSLAKHKRLHASGRENDTLKCKICQRDFRRESALNRHMSAHLNPNYFECEECKLPLPSLISLQRHKLGHQSSCNTFDCKVCKVSFLTKDRLGAHQTHTGHNQDRKRFECNVCHETFFVGREFSQHIKLHPKYKMSECTLCGKRLSTVQSLMLHLDRHFESNSILCPHCGKQFFEERNYHRHLLTHNGFKPFACDVEGCNKCFYTYFELNRHKKYHNNTRDFSCPHCPKSFHEANHLKVHIRTHTGERPYTCPHCNKGFVTRTRCKQHINLIHQGIGCDLIQSNISKKVAVFEAVEATA